MDIRLCPADTIPLPYFNEGTEVLLEKTNPNLQSYRVVDTDTTRAASMTMKKFGYAGDCWEEFRQQLKTPFGFLK